MSLGSDPETLSQSGAHEYTNHAVIAEKARKESSAIPVERLQQYIAEHATASSLKSG